MVSIFQMPALYFFHSNPIFLPKTGLLQFPSEKYNRANDQPGNSVAQKGKRGERLGNAVARFREKETESAIHQKGMNSFSQKTHCEYADPGVREAFDCGKEQAGEHTEQDACPNAQQNAFQRMTAQHGGEELVKGSHIAGAGLPHACKSEQSTDCRCLRHTGHGAGQQDGNIGKGDGEGFYMKISQKGKRHQQLDGGQCSQNGKSNIFLTGFCPMLHAQYPFLSHSF